MPGDDINSRIPKLTRCSFCGKTSEQVRRMVAGPNVQICNECILLCQEIISDDFTSGVSIASPMKLVNIGFGNMVSSRRMLSIVSPDSAPIKRLVQEAKERSMVIDASFGRRTKSVIIMDTDHVVLSAIPPETIAKRMSDKEGEVYKDEEETT